MKMKKHNVIVIAAAIALAFSAGAMATSMSPDANKAGKTSIATEYKSDRVACDSFSANAKDICIAEAKGKEKVAKADLEAGYKPSNENRYKVGVARAEADYAVARQKCDDKAGNSKDVCIKEAKAAQIAAKADAKALLKTSKANQIADDKAAAARIKAREASGAARQDAATDKRDADYAVAKEKCDVFAGDAKAACVKDAKARYGQS
jgi:hypothetical protein